MDRVGPATTLFFDAAEVCSSRADAAGSGADAVGSGADAVGSGDADAVFLFASADDGWSPSSSPPSFPSMTVSSPPSSSSSSPALRLKKASTTSRSFASPRLLYSSSSGDVFSIAARNALAVSASNAPIGSTCVRTVNRIHREISREGPGRRRTVSYSTRRCMRSPASSGVRGRSESGSMYPVCLESSNVGSATGTFASPSPSSSSRARSAARAAAALARFATPPMATFVGCHSRSVLITSGEFCNTQLARHSGFSSLRLVKTRATASRILRSYPGTGRCTCDNVLPWRFLGSKLKQTTPARKTCLATLKSPTASSSSDPSPSAMAFHNSSTVSSRIRHSSS